MKRQVKHIDVRLTKRLEECNRQLLELKRNCDGVTVLDSVMHIYLKLLSLMAEMERLLEDYKQFAEREDLPDYILIRMFITVYEKLDEGIILCRTCKGWRSFPPPVCESCGESLKEYIEKGIVRYCFRLRLLPIQYYKNCSAQRRMIMQCMRNGI